MVTAMTLLVGGAVLGILIGRYLAVPGAWEGDPAAALVERWRRRRDGIAKTLADVAFDREAGKISEEEFQSIRADCERRLAEADGMLVGLRKARLRTLSNAPSSAGRAGLVRDEVRSRIEASVRERKERLEAATRASSPVTKTGAA